MSMSKLVNVFPNPYCHLDADGRLAGACPMGEEVRSGEFFPTRAHVGARREVAEYKPQRSATQLSRAKFTWRFDSEPSSVPFDGALQAFYMERFRSGELLEVPSDGMAIATGDDGKPKKMPLVEALARSRMKAFDAHRAAYGSAPDTSMWAEQFAADAQVEPVHAELEKKRAEALKKQTEEDEKAAKAAPAKKSAAYSLTPPTKN